MGKRFFFKKEERLSGKTNISLLFDKGSTINVPPLKVIYFSVEEDMNFPAKALFSVSKKVFKKNVDRNRYKRRMREAYRQNKYQLYEMLNKLNKQIHIAYIYNNQKDIDYSIIEKAILNSFVKIEKNLG